MYIKLQGSNELLAFSGLNDRLAMPGANDQQQGSQSKLPDEPRCVEADINVGGLTLGNSFAIIIAGLMLVICDTYKMLERNCAFSYSSLSFFFFQDNKELQFTDNPATCICTEPSPPQNVSTMSSISVFVSRRTRHSLNESFK